MKRQILAVVVLAAVSAPLGAEESPFNVDFVFGWDGLYRPLEWTPIEIGIASKLKKPFGGTLTVAADQDGLTRLRIHRQFVLTPDLPLRIPVVNKLAYFADDCTVTLRDERGRVKWQNTYNLWDLNITIANPQDVMIGLCGLRGPSLLRLERHCMRQGSGMPGRTYVRDKLPRALPWDWTGYSSLDVLVLYDLDWDQINTHQMRALSEWVSNGGCLMVVLGAKPLDPSHPLAELLPVTYGEPTQRILEGQLHERFRPTEPVRVVGRALAARTDGTACGIRLGLGEEAPLWGTGLVGFGRVGVLGFDPTTLELAEEHRIRFWIARLDELLRGAGYRQTNRPQRALPGPMPKAPMPTDIPPRAAATRTESSLQYVENAPSQVNNQYGSFQPGSPAQASNQVLEDMLTIPELRPLNIGWVIGLLVLLALLLGPVDYLVLRKLGKLPLTWVTSSLLIALFTVGAYYGVRALRSGDARLRVRSLVDVVQGRPAWRTTYAGIFAPISDEYVLGGLGEGEWWSGISPVQEHIWRYQTEGLLRTVDCIQGDGVNLPAPLPINIWSMQCLLCEEPAQPPPLIATARRDGQGYVVTVENRSDARISRGRVFTPMGSGWLREVPPGQQREIRIRPDVADQGGSWNPIARGHGAAQRTPGIEAYLAAGGVVVRADFDEPPPPVSLENRDARTDHEFAVRLVIPAEEVLP